MGKHAPGTGDEGQVKTAKVSKDKVKKSSKAEKSRDKRQKRKDKLAAAIEEETGAADKEVEADDQPETGDGNQLDEKRETRKNNKKKLKKPREEPQQQSQGVVAEPELDPSPMATNLVEETRQNKKAKTKEERSKASDSGKTSGSTDEQPLFWIDTKPTKIDEESQLSHSGLNRAARRRLLMVEQHKQRIAKKVTQEGQLEAGSGEFDQEVQQRLDAWTEDRDIKMQKRTKGPKMQHRKTRGRSNQSTRVSGGRK